MLESAPAQAPRRAGSATESSGSSRSSSTRTRPRSLPTSSPVRTSPSRSATPRRRPFATSPSTRSAAFTMLHHLPTAQQQFRDPVRGVRVLRPGGTLVGADDRLASQGLHEFHEGDTYNPIDPAPAARLPASGRLRPGDGFGSAAASSSPPTKHTRKGVANERHDGAVPGAARPPRAERAPDPGAAAARRGRRPALRDLRRQDPPRPSGRTTAGRCIRRSEAACPALSGSRAASTSTPRRPAGESPGRLRSRRGARRAPRSSRSATSPASTSTAGATAARTSTSGSCHVRSGCWRHGDGAATLGGRPPKRARRGVAAAAESVAAAM